MIILLPKSINYMQIYEKTVFLTSLNQNLTLFPSRIKPIVMLEQHNSIFFRVCKTKQETLLKKHLLAILSNNLLFVHIFQCFGATIVCTIQSIIALIKWIAPVCMLSVWIIATCFFEIPHRFCIQLLLFCSII